MIENFITYGTGGLTPTIIATAPANMTITATKDANLLPSEYQEVEYIESTGTQYILIDTIPFDGIHIIADMVPTIKPTGSDTAYDLFGAGTDISNQFACDQSYSCIACTIGGMPAQINILAINQHNYIDINTNYQTIVFTVNNNTITFSPYYTDFGDYPLCILGYNDAGSISDIAYAKLYSFTIYSYDKCIHQFIPCYRIADNEIGLYDIITNKFYVNAGTGTFLKGIDISSNSPIVYTADIEDNTYTFSNLPLGTYTISGNDRNEIITIDTTQIYTCDLTGAPLNNLWAEYLFENRNYSDSSGHHYNGTAGSSLDWESGLINNSTYALVNDGGSGSKYDSDINDNILSTEIFTISLWCDLTNSNENIINFQNTFNNLDLGFSLINYKLIWQLYIYPTQSGGEIIFTTNTTLGLHHIVININQTAKTLALYIDNILQIANIDITNNYRQLLDHLIIPASGKVDNVRIYNKVLSDTEIAALYNNGEGC